MSQEKPKKAPGPEPERLKIEGDPEQQFRKLLRPPPQERKDRPKRRKRGSAGR